MTWLWVLAIVGTITTVTLWAVFAYIAVRELRAEMPGAAFGRSLEVPRADQQPPIKILVPVDGSRASVAAVQEVAHCPLPAGSSVELLYAIHSRLPVIPDFPPWAVTIAAAHGESVRAQTLGAPGVLAAAETYLRTHQRDVTIGTKIVEGVPKDEILREASAWGANRIVLGSHGRRRADRAILGSTAGAVAAGAACTVQIARAPVTGAQAIASAITT